MFDEGSGDTHRMDGLSAVALMCLEGTPRDLPDLVAQVAVETDLAEDETLSGMLASVIEKFTRLGLIEPAAS